MNRTRIRPYLFGPVFVLCMMISGWAGAHHVLGRPSYALNEDSNTPSAMQVETQIGDYFVNYMVYPAFPRAEVPGRINLYISPIGDGTPFDGEVTFKVKDDAWFAGEEEILGTQGIDDAVFRQGFQFSRDGNYIITATFNANGEPYVIDFPLRIGSPSAIGPLGIAVGVVVMILLTVSMLKRRHLLRSKIRQTREERRA